MKRGLVISDLHVGSIFGMLPSGFIASSGERKVPNDVQDFLNRSWDHFGLSAAEFDPDFVIANGDMVDGKQRRQNGSEYSLPLMIDQERAAIEILRRLQVKLRSKCKWYFVQGTEYHVGESGLHEEHIAESLNGQKYWSLGSGVFVREVLWLAMEGVTIESSHHIAAGTGFYRATALDREMQWSAMAAKDATKGVPKADLLIRSHVHHTLSLGHPSKQGVISPCWQLQTRFMRKNSAYRMLPDIGGLLITVDGSRKAKGRKPCLIDEELYPLPPVTVTQL